MKRFVILPLMILGTLAMVNACVDHYDQIEATIRIVNQSSSQVEGEMRGGGNHFSLAPEEKVSWNVNLCLNKKEGQSISDWHVLGPWEITVDGVRYEMKDSSEKDFFHVHGWALTENSSGPLFELVLTDESIGRMLSYAKGQ